MADLYRDEGRFAEAYRLLDRAAQVIRVSEGLYTRFKSSGKDEG